MVHILVSSSAHRNTQYLQCVHHMEVNLIAMAAFGLLVGTGFVVVLVRLLTVDKAVEKSGAYFSKLMCTQKYVCARNKCHAIST